MAVNKTVQGLVTAPGGRTTTGRDYVAIAHPASLTILYIKITGGSATLDIEVSDDPGKPPIDFFPIKEVTVSGVHRVSMPSSLVAINVRSIGGGANVQVRYRTMVLDNMPEYAIDTFQEGDIVARRISITGSATVSTFSTQFRKKLAQVEVAATATTIYTVPADRQTEIKTIFVVNTDSIDHVFSLWHDGSADVNKILPPVTILAGGFAVFNGSHQMETGDTLVADADGAGVITITMSGTEEPIPV